MQQGLGSPHRVWFGNGLPPPLAARQPHILPATHPATAATPPALPPAPAADAGEEDSSDDEPEGSSSQFGGHPNRDTISRMIKSYYGEGSVVPVELANRDKGWVNETLGACVPIRVWVIF